MCEINQIRHRARSWHRLAAAGLLGMALAACSSGTQHRQPPVTPVVVQAGRHGQPVQRPRRDETPVRHVSAIQRDRVPGPVVAVGEYGENAFEAVQQGRWARAQALADSIRRAAAALPSREDPLATRVREAAAALDRAVRRHDRPASLEAANRITYLAVELARPYAGATPSEIALMDYRGRELQRAAEVHDSAALRRTTSDIESGWRTLRPDIERRDARARRQARRFDKDVSRVQRARTRDEYQRASQQMLDDVDSLETVVGTH
jgi:hypothetical protein